MSEHDFLFTYWCDNYFSEFIFKDGTHSSGVISTFFIDEPNTYYLLLGADRQKYHLLEKAKNVRGMKKLCRLVDLQTITSAKRIH